MKERGGTVYRTFTLVNEDERMFCVAFGKEHVDALEGREDAPVKLTRYVIAEVGGSRIVRVTENSRMTFLEEDALPSITQMLPARAPTLAAARKRGSWIVSVLVLHQEVTENMVCPHCRRLLELVDEEWLCPIHGPVEPELRKVYRYQLANSSGVYPGVFYGEPPEENLELKKILVKGRFRGEEFLITRIYAVEESVEKYLE